MIIGVYGPIGSGKTTLVKQYAEENNYEYISLDKVAKDLLANNQSLIDELKNNKLGNKVIVNNKVDNRIMTKYIFGSYKTNHELSMIIWPYVKNEAESIINNANMSNKGVILEAATLPGLVIRGIDKYVYITKKLGIISLFKLAKEKHKSVLQIIKIRKIQKKYNKPFIKKSIIVKNDAK